MLSQFFGGLVLQVFWMCVGLLQAAYASACVIGVTSMVVWSRIAMVLDAGSSLL